METRFPRSAQGHNVCRPGFVTVAARTPTACRTGRPGRGGEDVLELNLLRHATIPIDMMLVHPGQRLLGHEVPEYIRQHEIAQDPTHGADGLAAAAARPVGDNPLNTPSADAFESRERLSNTGDITQTSGQDDAVLERH